MAKRHSLEFLESHAIDAEDRTDGQDTQPVEQEASEEAERPTRVETANERAERLHVEEQQRKKQEFYDKVMEARRPEQPAPVTQPVATRIMEQTQAEMEAGRAMNEHHEKLKALRPRVIPSEAEKAATGNTTPVFRPEDHVPKFGQGNVGARTLS